MVFYKTKAHPIPGTRYADVAPQARALLRTIERRTKRRPYLRSAYFKKDKIFLTYYWKHLSQLKTYQRTRRLKYLPCAIELLRKSRHQPERYRKREQEKEVYYRFFGISPNGIEFVVQVKGNEKTNRKELLSVFPRK